METTAGGLPSHTPAPMPIIKANAVAASKRRLARGRDDTGALISAGAGPCIPRSIRFGLRGAVTRVGPLACKLPAFLLGFHQSGEQLAQDFAPRCGQDSAVRVR